MTSGAFAVIQGRMYTALFCSAFLAATLLPAQSELSLAALVATRPDALWPLFAVATVGNTLGSAVNWLLGRFCMRFANRKWFPVSRASLDKAEAWYRRHGRWSLLLSWAPVIGDPLTMAAGLLREPFCSFIVLVALAKAARYAVVVALALGIAA